MKITAPGFHDLVPADYHADPAPEPSLSSTLARRLIGQSPRHAWTASPRLNPGFEPEEKEAFDIGRVAHELILGKGDGYCVVNAPDWRRKDARETRDWARAVGKVPLLQAQFDAAQIMAYECAGALADMRIDLASMRREVSAFAQIDGIWCRAMFDAWDEAANTFYDLKTCESAALPAVIRSVANYGYDFQAAFYQDVVKAVTGRTPRCVFVFVEKQPPHEVAVVELEDDMGAESDWMEPAREKCAFARRRWRDCLAADFWPGYPRRLATLGAPAWHLDAWHKIKGAMPTDNQKPTRAALETSAAMQAPSEMMEDT